MSGRWLQTTTALISGLVLFAMPILLLAADSNRDDSRHNESYFYQLDRLDDLRLADFKSFQTELAEMHKVSAYFNAAEQDYFTLLVASEAALLSDFNKTISLLENRWSSVVDRSMSTRMLALLVNSLVLSQNYLHAFEYFEQLIGADSGSLDEKAVVQRIGVIALLYNRLGKHDLALYYLEDIDTLPISALNLCRLYVPKVEAMLPSATIEAFEAAAKLGFDLCVANNERIPAGLISAELIRFNVTNKRFEHAIAIYQAFKPTLYATKYNFLIAKHNAYASQAYFHANNVTHAEQLAVEALSFANLGLNTLPVVEAAKSLYTMAKSQNRSRDALGYLEIYLNAQNKYNDDLSAQLLAFNLAKSEVEVKNQRIALLNKDNELLHLQKSVYEQQVKQTRLLIGGLVLVLVFSSIVAFQAVKGRRRFKKIAEFDLLTGASNLYHFNYQARLALESCEKNRKPVAVILFDLDHFKSINDNYGHAAGDWALVSVVAACNNFMRKNDVFGRIGGEEFAVILPGCEIDKAMLLAEICRDAINTVDSHGIGATFSLSASFGVSGSESSGYQLKQLLADADKALYRAKDGGRNQVVSSVNAAI